MKSRLTFDLDSQNRAIILVHVELTEDVRDKIAKQFQERFRTEGSLASISYFPSSENNLDFKLVSHSGEFNDCLEMASNLSYNQMNNLSEAMRWERWNREKGNFTMDSKVKPPKDFK